MAGTSPAAIVVSTLKCRIVRLSDALSFLRMQESNLSVDCPSKQEGDSCIRRSDTCLILNFNDDAVLQWLCDKLKLTRHYSYSWETLVATTLVVAVFILYSDS